MNSASIRSQNHLTANSLSGTTGKGYKGRPKTSHYGHSNSSAPSTMPTKGLNRSHTKLNNLSNGFQNGHCDRTSVHPGGFIDSRKHQYGATNGHQDSEYDGLEMHDGLMSIYENGGPVSYPSSESSFRFETQRSQESFSREHEQYISLLRRNWQTAVDKCSSKTNQEPNLPNVMRRVSSGPKLSQVNTTTNNNNNSASSNQQSTSIPQSHTYKSKSMGGILGDKPTDNSKRSASIRSNSSTTASHVENSDSNQSFKNSADISTTISKTDSNSSLSNGPTPSHSTLSTSASQSILASNRRELTLFYYNEKADSAANCNGDDSANKYIDAWLEEQILNQVFQTS